MHAIIWSRGIQGWIPKQRINSVTQILQLRKQIPVSAQKRFSTTTTDKAERRTKKVKVSPLNKLDMTIEEYNSYLKKTQK